jgi:hypothetical protein
MLTASLTGGVPCEDDEQRATGSSQNSAGIVCAGSSGDARFSRAASATADRSNVYVMTDCGGR